MEKQELMTQKEMKKNVPTWVISMCATLMFLSIFINSIGLNLMQINGAITNWIVIKLNTPEAIDAEYRNHIEIRLEMLEAVAHESTTKGK